jgi:hypothetical protein
LQEELLALFGLMYMRGLLGANLIDARQLWTSNYSPVFAATMAYNRYGTVRTGSYFQQDHTFNYKFLTSVRYAGQQQLYCI